MLIIIRALASICSAFLFFMVPLSIAQEAPPQKPVQPQVQPAAPQSNLSATKRAEPVYSSPFYGSVELRHHLNTYVNSDETLLRREPSMHTRLQLGMHLYDNLIDAYATVGAYKVPHTQQVSQRRPELAIDIYPYNSETISVLWYNLVQTPFRTADDPLMDLDREDMGDRGGGQDGTITTIGLAPVARIPFQVAASKVTFKGGSDIWTKFYSRKQYVTNKPEEDHPDHFGLRRETEDSSGEPVEDYAQHLATQFLMGAALWSSSFPSFTGEAGVYYDTRYIPVYGPTEDGSGYTYAAERTSHYRLRAQFALSSRATLINDFYHFENGLFAASRVGEDRRYRNILRVTWRL